MGGWRLIMRLAVVLAAIASFSACADETQGSNNGSDADASDAMTADTSQNDDTASDDTGSDDTGTDATTSGDVVPICRTPCQSASECGEPDEPLLNPDNHVCEDGICVFTGCSSDAECVDGIGEGYGCDDSYAIPSCQKTCSDVSECTQGGSLNDDDNYSCSAGFCRFDGCNNEQECVDGIGEGYTCAQPDILPMVDIPSCVKACSSAADCGTPTGLYGEDNYACVEGACVWTGCNTTEECNEAIDRGLVCE